jgi:hypothetical protein
MVVQPMSDVGRIAVRRDSIADGVLKGAVLGFVVGLFNGGQGCGNYETCVFLATVTYGAIGGGIDYLHGRSLVLYDRRSAPSPALTWRVTF